MKVLLRATSATSTMPLTARQRANLELIDSLKRYTVDSMGYDPSRSYSRVYYHGRDPVVWVVTASKPYFLEPVYWHFPIVGPVSYKGFFDHTLAGREFLNLRAQGYDVEISPVTAYSTLGWFSDPLFSGMLDRGKGAFCNLIMHELFHATFYKPGKVNLNENLASFVAHKGTLRFLRSDPEALRAYLDQMDDNTTIRAYLQREARALDALFKENVSRNDSVKLILKRNYYWQIADSLMKLRVNSRSRLMYTRRKLLSSQNAYFVGYSQYESLQDSLEDVFNKIYRGDIKKMVRGLKRL